MNEILKKLSTKPRQVKSPKTNLLVRFPNGRVFYNDVALETFEEVILYIGPEKIRRWEIDNDIRERIIYDHPENRAKRPIGNGKYMMSNTSTERKKKLLDCLSDGLRLNLDVEIINNEN